MRTRILGLVAGIALLGGGAALAQDSATQSKDQSVQTSTRQSDTSSTRREGGHATVTVEKGQQGTGGAGQGSQMKSDQAQQGPSAGASAGTSATAEAESTLTGTVVKADKSLLFVRSHEGAVVPLKLDRKTQFADPSLKSAKDLKEGQQVRASFTVKKTDNLATKLEAMDGSAQGTGGAGSWESRPSDTSGNAGSSASGTTGDLSPEPGTAGQTGAGAATTPDEGAQKK